MTPSIPSELSSDPSHTTVLSPILTCPEPDQIHLSQHISHFYPSRTEESILKMLSIVIETLQEELQSVLFLVGEQEEDTKSRFWKLGEKMHLKQPEKSQRIFYEELFQLFTFLKRSPPSFPLVPCFALPSVSSSSITSLSSSSSSTSSSTSTSSSSPPPPSPPQTPSSDFTLILPLSKPPTQPFIDPSFTPQTPPSTFLPQHGTYSNCLLSSYFNSFHYFSGLSFVDIYERPIESGGQGTVVIVKGKENGHLYARKIFHSSHSEKDAEKEIKFSLSHCSPYLVGGIDWYRYEGQKYLVMELCSELSLLHYIGKELKNKKFISSETFFRFAIDIGKGLLYLHSHNIIHRDIKMSNILVTSDLHCDFGLIHYCDGKPYHGKGFSGTHGYAAPEVENSFLYSFSSDIYSFGIVLSEILSGAQPSGKKKKKGREEEKKEEEETKEEFSFPSSNKSPSPPLPFPPSIPEEVKNLLSSMIEKEEEKRPEITTILNTLQSLSSSSSFSIPPYPPDELESHQIVGISTSFPFSSFSSFPSSFPSSPPSSASSPSTSSSASADSPSH